MTQFWFGFITAVALIAVGVITTALLSYRRSERKRQAHVDAIMAKVTAGQISVNEARSELEPQPSAKRVH